MALSPNPHGMEMSPAYVTSLFWNDPFIMCQTLCRRAILALALRGSLTPSPSRLPLPPPHTPGQRPSTGVSSRYHLPSQEITFKGTA